MTEAAVALAHKLARTTSRQEALALLVAAPVLSPPELMEAVRHPDRYGIAPDDARELTSLANWLAKILQALTGGLDPAVPAPTYGALAMICRQQGKQEQAKRFYQYSFSNAKLPVEKAAAMSGMAILEMQQGKTAPARARFTQAIAFCKNSGVGGRTLAHLFSNLGGLEMNARQWTTAEDLFAQALAIGVREALPDVSALARRNQEELARRQGNNAPAGSPQDLAALALPQPADLAAQTIEELEERLLNPATDVSAFDDTDRALVQKELGSKYFALRTGRRIENIQAAVNYWEAALAVVEKRDEEALKPAIAGLHGDLGLAYNEWFALDHASASAGSTSTQAREHFEAALKILPQTPEFADYRRTLLNNLANASAWEAGASLSWITAGQPDRDALRQSLDTQAQLLQELEHDPEGRCKVLVNLCQTYGELGEADPDGARDSYYPAAWDCVLAAEKTLNSIPHPDAQLTLGILVKKAQTAADVKRPPAELAGLAQQLDSSLRQQDLAAIRPAVWATGFRQSARLARLLGNPSRSYRRLLTAMRKLRLRVPDLPGALDAAAADVHRTNTDLVASLTESGELERAVFFAGTPPSERETAWPRRGQRGSAAGSCAILFHLISKTRLTAFVITETGVQVRDSLLDPLGLIRLGARFLTAKSTSASSSLTPASDPAWLAAIDAVGEAIGENLFRPLEDLLPANGALFIIPESPVMRLLPLHLAKLADGRPLLDRFEITCCSQLSFAENHNLVPSAPESGQVFVAAYSPPNARLPFAALEAGAVAGNYHPAARVETGDRATPEAILTGLEQSRIAHLCSHGNFDSEVPLDSQLFFAGRGLTVREIQLSLARSPSDLIVLAACEAGARGGGPGERSDFTSILLGAGCATVIAADWRIDDVSTTLLMYFLHAGLAAGAKPAEALATAQRKVAAETGPAIAERARNWLAASPADLSPEERNYVSGKLDALEARDAAVFSHPVYWGSFSVNAFSFPLTPQVTPHVTMSCDEADPSAPGPPLHDGGKPDAGANPPLSRLPQ